MVPALVQPTAGTGTPALFAVPSVTAAGPSVALFAVCSFDDQLFPDVEGFVRLQSSAGFALYAPKALLLSKGETSAAPRIGLTGATADVSPVIGTASLAIVAHP